MRIILISVFLAVMPGFAIAQSARLAGYCSLFPSQTQAARIVKTKTSMTWSTISRVDGGDPFFFSPACNNPDYFAFADFSNARSATLTNFLDSMAPETEFILELEVTGRLETSLFPSFGHLSWSRSNFQVLKIHTIANVTSRPDVIRPHHEEGPLTTLGFSLDAANDIVARFFLTGSGAPEIDSFLSSNFTATEEKGRKYDKTNYRELAGTLFRNAVGYPKMATRREGVEVKGSLYTVIGSIWVENVAGKKQVLRYENTFDLSDNSFLLIRSRFTGPLSKLHP